jgi:hypothetical protein
MDWKAIVSKSLTKEEVELEPCEEPDDGLELLSIKEKTDESSSEVPKDESVNNIEEEETRFCDPNFDFDYEHSDNCYSSIDRFKRYINRMDEPLFDNGDNFTTDLYNFIKYNSYEYSDIVRNIDKVSDDEFDSSDEEYYDENF